MRFDRDGLVLCLEVKNADDFFDRLVDLKGLVDTAEQALSHLC